MKPWLPGLRRLPLIRAWYDASGRIAAQRDQASAERDAAIAERDAAITERNAAIAERDAALLANAQLPPPAAALRPKCDAAPPHADGPSRAAVSDRLRLSAEPRGSADRRAVIVPVHGAVARREIAVTQPFFADYCRAIGADLRILDVADGVSDLLVKASVLPIAREYRRFAILDSDILIRRGCPDLFARSPEGELAAMIEGRWLDRGRVCAELSDMYGFSKPLSPDRYVDTGLMVMSERHLPLLESLSHHPTQPHPRDEQGFINACLYREGVPVHGLAREFNWVPYTEEEFDWRWAWVFRIGDHWRAPPKQQTALRGNDRDGWREAALEPRHCRLPCLIEVAGQLRGETLRVVHPGEMGYHPPAGRLMIAEDEAAIMSCTPWPRAGFAGLHASPPIYGPYAALEQGRWSVSLLAADGQTPADEAIVVDMAYDVGRVTLRPPAPVGPGAAFGIVLEQDAPEVEVRIYRGEREFAVGAIVFRRLPEDGGEDPAAR